MIPGKAWNLNDCNGTPVILAEWSIKIEISLAYWEVKLHFLHTGAFGLWFITMILVNPKVLEMVVSGAFISFAEISVFLQETSHLKAMSNKYLKTLWSLFPAKCRADSLSRVLSIFFIIYPQICLPLLSYDNLSLLLTPLVFSTHAVSFPYTWNLFS